MVRPRQPPAFEELRARLLAVRIALDTAPGQVLAQWDQHHREVQHVQALLIERLPLNPLDRFASEFGLSILPGLGGLTLLSPDLWPLILAGLSLVGAFWSLGQGMQRYLLGDRCEELLTEVVTLRTRLLVLRDGPPSP